MAKCAAQLQRPYPDFRARHEKSRGQRSSHRLLGAAFLIAGRSGCSLSAGSIVGTDPVTIGELKGIADRQAADSRWAFGIVVDLRKVQQPPLPDELQALAAHVRGLGGEAWPPRPRRLERGRAASRADLRTLERETRAPCGRVLVVS